MQYPEQNDFAWDASKLFHLMMMDGLLRPEKRPRNDVPPDLCNNAVNLYFFYPAHENTLISR